MKFCTPARNEGHPPCGGPAHRHEDDHDQPRVGHVVGDAGQAEDRGMLDRVHGSVLRARLSEAAQDQGAGQDGEARPRRRTGAPSRWPCRPAVATARAMKRIPKPRAHPPGAGTPSRTLTTRPASQRKLAMARTPPAPTPAATGTPPTRPDTRTERPRRRRSPTSRATSTPSGSWVLHPSFGRLDGAKHAHEAGDDPQHKAEQHQPWGRPEPPIGVVAGGQPETVANTMVIPIEVNSARPCQADGSLVGAM